MGASEDENGSRSRSRRQHGTGASTIRAVVTSPPWARYEPAEPDIDANPIGPETQLRPMAYASTSAVVEASSTTSVNSTDSTPDSRGWRFLLNPLRKTSLNAPNAMPTAREDEDARARAAAPSDSATSYFPQRLPRRGTSLRIPVPRRERSFTMAQSKTPGWSTPWAPHGLRPPSEARLHRGSASFSDPDMLRMPGDEKSVEQVGVWRQRSRNCKTFVLHNHYVPLLFRILNISFTTATLAVAVRMRSLELKFGIMGAVGSSPLLAIIFSPLTLLHVMFAIYLEYFGRPLGLWKTSGKLAHTLIEVVFICLWSGSFSIALDNYYTSPLLCVLPSSNSWWNHLPPEASPIPFDTGRHEGGVADHLCDDQLAMVCLEFVGLWLYCSNLVISLFRIFEKVKSHTSMARSYA